ncbi:MAG: hypothetical protein IPK35_00310 [Saprospiraceae bacterium]|nr:hypothetical protein [Saprospiraceae bacterium]
MTLKFIHLIIFCSFTLPIFSQTPTQDLEVLMIGASHSYDPNSNQDLTRIHEKIRIFKPDAFFGEWLSPEDEKSIKNYWNKANVLKRTSRLMSRKPIKENDLNSEINQLENHENHNPDDMKAHIDLAFAYYLNLDAGNGYFQMWQVAKYLKSNQQDTAVFNYARRLFLPVSIDSLHKMINYYSDDEYDYIAHPMMIKFGMKKMYPMDSQRWDEKWNKAWAEADSIFKTRLEVYKTDSLSQTGIKVNQLNKLVQKRMDYLMEDAVKKYGENHFTEVLNSPQITEWIYRINFVSDEYRQLDFFPADFYGWMLHYWWLRNNDMCDNTINRAKSNLFKKVVIVVGTNHAAIMTKLFKEKGIKVTNINDAPEE